MRIALFLCLLAVTLSSVYSAPWLQCNFLPNSTYLVLTNNGCTNYTGQNCVANEIPGQFIPYGSCVMNTNSPSDFLGVNVQYFGVQNSSVTPLYDYGSTYQLEHSVGDVFVSYWNDDVSVSTARYGLDIIGQSVPGRVSYAGANKIQVTVGNYVNNLNPNNGNRNYLEVIIGNIGNYTTGYRSTRNAYFRGNSYTSESVSVTDWAEKVWVSVYKYNPCVGLTTPLWFGYINGTTAGNDTFIALYGDLATGQISVWNAQPANLTNAFTTYSACNFVSTPPTGGAGWPENNVNFTWGTYNGGWGGCRQLDHPVAAGVIPYGTCQTFFNGPPAGVYAAPSLAINGTTRSLGGRASSYYQIYGDGLDFMAALYVDASSAAGWAVDPIHDASSSTATAPGSTPNVGATCWPTLGYQTYVLGFYASNFATLNNASPYYFYVKFNNTYSVTCNNAAVYYGYSCYATVPSLPNNGQYNITVYTTACSYSDDPLAPYNTCSENYVTSTKTTVGDGKVGLVAFYGDAARPDGIKVASYLAGGAANDGTGGIGFLPQGAAASIVPQFAAIAAAMIAVIIVLFQ